MKPIIKYILIFLSLCILMEMVINYLNKDKPNIQENIIRVTYSNPLIANKIGELQSFTIEYTPILNSKDSLIFQMAIQGEKKYINYFGETYKNNGKWIITKLDTVDRNLNP